MVATTLPGTALCWGSVRGTGLLELADLAARHGFPEVSVSPGQYRSAGMADAEIVARLADSGLAVGVLDALMSALPGSPSPADVPADLRESYSFTAEQCIAAAVALGARTINLAHYLAAPATVPEMARAAGEVADAAGEAGLRICLEFIPGTGIPDLATAAEIVAAAGRPNVGVLFDTWHFLRAGGLPADLEDLPPGLVTEAQISDRIPPPDGTPYVPMAGRLPPGEGTWPVADVVRALRRATPDLVLSVEVFTAERGDPDRTVARLADATRTFLTRLAD